MTVERWTAANGHEWVDGPAYDALAARLAEAERDAARYRFMRNVPDWDRFLCVEGADLDRAIDEAARAWDARTADSAPVREYGRDDVGSCLKCGHRPCP